MTIDTAGERVRLPHLQGLQREAVGLADRAVEKRHMTVIAIEGERQFHDVLPLALKSARGVGDGTSADLFNVDHTPTSGRRRPT